MAEAPAAPPCCCAAAPLPDVEAGESLSNGSGRLEDGGNSGGLLRPEGCRCSNDAAAAALLPAGCALPGLLHCGTFIAGAALLDVVLLTPSAPPPALMLVTAAVLKPGLAFNVFSCRMLVR